MDGARLVRSKPDESAELRRVARHLRQRTDVAIRLIEVALIEHGASRHPLVDTLLDVRNALRGSDAG